MPLQSSGQIALLDIQNEFGGTPQIELGEYYKGGPFVSYTDNAPNVPTSGQISIGNFYGAAKVNIDITQSGLQLYYDLGKTGSYPGGGSTVYDISGNGRNGTLNNGAYWAYDYNGVSQNGNKSRIVFDGLDDFLSSNALTSGWPSTGCHTFRTFTWCFWMRTSSGQTGVVGGVTNNGFRDVVQFSTNRVNRDDNGYGTMQMYVRDGVDDGDYGYSIKWTTIGNPYAGPCFNIYPNSIIGAGWVYVCWRCLDNYYSDAYGYNYLRVFNSPNRASGCGVNSTGYATIYEHHWPFTYNCFEFPLYFGALNRRGSSFRWWNGELGQVQIYNRALSDAEMNYNFDQHRGRYQ